MLMGPPPCDFGAPAPRFNLPDPSGREFSLEDCAGENGTLVMFICNHCPYVQAILGKLSRDTAELREHGIGSVAIMPNDVVRYPADSPPRMAALAEQAGFEFPYLYDESQEVAGSYGAVCTPDFFGYNADLELQYRGRLDSSTSCAAPPDTPRELFDAMVRIARTGQGPRSQNSSQGCSIKWRS
ncbi:MAG: thioredoxin family protein [Gammaproteobacteria bacterium]|nr:thioredoxin family protein [Gammaproteobacteria bacterium]MYD00899.1 thioredoxin family protein [Gammaproteobacteria bacterium]MYI24993.1 thioredoxin family protein [Gammaproteobacteria bacterium]